MGQNSSITSRGTRTFSLNVNVFSVARMLLQLRKCNFFLSKFSENVICVIGKFKLYLVIPFLDVWINPIAVRIVSRLSPDFSNIVLKSPVNYFMVVLKD